MPNYQAVYERLTYAGKQSKSLLYVAEVQEGLFFRLSTHSIRLRNPSVLELLKLDWLFNMAHTDR